MVECHLAKVKVASSNLVSRSHKQSTVWVLEHLRYPFFMSIFYRYLNNLNNLNNLKENKNPNAGHNRIA